MKQLRHGVLVMMLLANLPRAAQAQSLLRGNVLAPDSMQIAAAHIMLHDAAGRLKAEMLTDSAGGFRFRVGNPNEPVTLYLSVVRIGFRSIERAPVRVGRNEDLMVRVFMSLDALALAPVTVVARARFRSPTLDDYYDKLADVKRGVGHAIERTDLQKYDGQPMMRALYRVPGMLYDNSAIALPRMRGGCMPLTMLDGVAIPAEELAALDPGHLEGVLVYVGGLEVPPDFSQLIVEARCGAILAYTAAPARGRRKLPILGVIAAVSAFAAVVIIPRVQ